MSPRAAQENFLVSTAIPSQSRSLEGRQCSGAAGAHESAASSRGYGRRQRSSEQTHETDFTARAPPSPGPLETCGPAREHGQGTGGTVVPAGQSLLLPQIKPVRTRLLGKLELGINFSF